MNRILGFIPARMRSTRLPKKTLADIGGKPMIFWTWDQARKSRLLDELIVATDSPRISKMVKAFGGKVVMTSPHHKSGTDRVGEAARNLRYEIVVNIQSDQPIISPAAIDAPIRLLLRNKGLLCSTVATSILTVDEAKNTNVVKVVIDQKGYALYFSRSLVPFRRNSYNSYLEHVGVYAFRRNFLLRYVNLDQTPLEQAEGLEQLRIMENGHRIKVAVGKFKNISVDTEEDLHRVRTLVMDEL